jgi:hypothetical protein
MLLGIDAQGTLTGVRVISHTETPGLGDKIETAKGDWILGFDGLSLHKPDDQGWHVKKDGGQFDSFTGATITPRAVVKGLPPTISARTTTESSAVKPDTAYRKTSANSSTDWPFSKPTAMTWSILSAANMARDVFKPWAKPPWLTSTK